MIECPGRKGQGAATTFRRGSCGLFKPHAGARKAATRRARTRRAAEWKRSVKLITARWTLLLLLPFALIACGRAETPRFIMATSFTRLPPEAASAEEKRAAAARAENQARDEVLSQALQLTFPNGTSLAEAALRDPFIRAKVYDTVRGARITDKTVTDDSIISVTVRLELDPIYRLLDTYNAPSPGA